MSNANGTCEYVLNPEDPSTWDGEHGDECYVSDQKLNENGVWQCPHTTEDGEPLCAFHRQDSVPEETIKHEFLNSIRAASEDENERKSEFIGSRIDELRLIDEEISVDLDSIDFTHSSFQGPFLAFQITISCGINFRGADFCGDVSLKKSRFRGELNFRAADFYEMLQSSGAVFEEDVGFPEAEFHKKADFELTEVRGSGFFEGTIFNGEVDFSGAEFSGTPNFAEAKFLDYANFERTTYQGDATFARSVFVSDCTFAQSEFVSFAGFNETKFKGVASFNLTTFNDVVFGGGVFEESATFRTTEFLGRTGFKEQDFETPPDFLGAKLMSTSFSNVDLQRADFRRANLDGAEFNSVDLTNTNFEQASLSATNLIGVDLSGARLYGARMGGAIVNTETVFDKYGDNRCVYDPKSKYEYEPDDNEEVGQLRKAMGAYHVLEQLTRANTLPDEQSKFFARRQDMRRVQLREDGRRLEYWFAEAQNMVFRHGESFSRVVGWSVGTIVAFAFIFPLGGWLQSDSTGTLTYGAIAESPELMWQAFYHSTLLFLTGGGPLSPTGFAGEVLTTIEALIAPILLALLIFVLGRRAAR